LKSLHIKGKVFSGVGEGSRFTELPWVKKQIEEKVGFTAHPGTLNLKIDMDNHEVLTSMKEARCIEISPAEGFSPGRLLRVNLNGYLECAIVIPCTLDYPKDVIEIIASKNLRKELQVEDGDPIEVQLLMR
jgi:CTP-dependent riboflavin kinase